MSKVVRKAGLVVGTVATIAAFAVPVVGPALGMTMAQITSTTALASAPSRKSLGKPIR